MGGHSASEPITAKRNARNIPATLTALSRLQTPQVKENFALKKHLRRSRLVYESTAQIGFPRIATPLHLRLQLLGSPRSNFRLYRSVKWTFRGR